MEQGKKRIMAAALECIERYGVEGTTIRRIAQISGMNSAAVSYYFRSKDKLIEEVLWWNISDALSWQDFEQYAALPIEQQLVEIFLHLAKGGIQYPNLVRAQFKTALSGDYNGYAAQEVNAFLQRLHDHIKKYKPDCNDENVRNSLWIMCGNLFCFLILMPGLFEAYTRKSLEKEENLRACIEELVKRNFHT